MTEYLKPLIEALRDELSQYGEMLALLDQQQETILHRRTADLLETTEAINSQGRLLQTVRRQREDRQRELAAESRPNEQASLGLLSSLAPAEYRPLIDALVRENNQLLLRIQQRVRQNHLLLNRAIELSERLISSLCPGSTTVYNDAGGLRPAVTMATAMYEAVG